jgi:flagellar biosynthetic protein FliR
MIESFVYNFQSFMMIFARIMGLFSLAPVYSSEAISFQIRVMLAFLLSLILFPVTANYLHAVPPGMDLWSVLFLQDFKWRGNFLVFKWVLVIRKF